MSKVLFAVDNSNIHIETQKSFGYDARFSYTKFEKNFYGSHDILAKQMTGSTPPSTDAFWDKMRREGWEVTTYERRHKYQERRQDYYGRRQVYHNSTEEKGVDTAIATRATEAIVTLRPDILVLFSGDLDMKPLVEMAKKYSCVIHMWTYKNSSSAELASECDEVYYIDHYLSELIFYQGADGSIELYDERMERVELERQQQEERHRQREESRPSRETEEESGIEIPNWLVAIFGVAGTVGLGGIIWRVLKRR